MTDTLTPDKPNDYGELSAPDLAKLINEEYSVIHAGERNTFQRALAIGEKLMWLRAKAKHGEWKEKLEGWCPKLSYETATLYIRLAEKRHIWEPKAKAKSVETTDLTIEEVRQLLAKPKPKADSEHSPDDEVDDDAGNGGKPTVEAMIAKQTANAEAEAAALEDVDLDGARQQRVDWMFAKLMQQYPQDELLDLTERLAKHLGMTLMPLANLEALMEITREPSPA